MRIPAAMLVILCWAAPAAAQSPYIGASLLGDIIRLSHDTGHRPGPGGEALGGALRLGAPLGSQWGAEVEFARSREIEARPEVTVFGGVGSFGFTDASGDTTGADFRTPEITSRHQLSTLTAAVWWRHELGARAEIVYLGGVAFTRTETAVRYAFLIPIPVRPGSPPIPPIRQMIAIDAVDYESGATVGIEGRIGMTDHLRFVPGVRLLALGGQGGWAIRPAVGVQWAF